MTLQPVTEDGQIVDYFDDGHTEASEDGAEAASAAVGPEREEPATDEQAASPTPQPSQPASARKVTQEDPTDFDASDVKIEILLHRADGHPQGRLVSVFIHNFSGTPMAQDFREADLSDKARLDSIHRAIYPVMQRFLLDLSARKQKKLEEEAKRAPRPAPHVSGQAAASTPSKVVTAASVPPHANAPSANAALTTSTAKPASTASTEKDAAAVEGGKRKDGGKQQGKYQSIPLF
jgi:hypothetical protein